MLKVHVLVKIIKEKNCWESISVELQLAKWRNKMLNQENVPENENGSLENIRFLSLSPSATNSWIKIYNLWIIYYLSFVNSLITIWMDM